MPSLGSVAVREEQAIERIKGATKKLRLKIGHKLVDYAVGETRVHPMERHAMTLEWAAELLEKLVEHHGEGEEETVELDVKAQEEEEEEDGGDNESAGGELTSRITPNTIRRSKSKRDG